MFHQVFLGCQGHQKVKKRPTKKSKVKNFYCCFFLGTLYKRMYLYTSQELRILSRSLKSFSRLFHEILYDGTTSDAQNHELERRRPVIMLKLNIFVNPFRYVAQKRIQLSSKSKSGKLFCLIKGLFRVAAKSEALFSQIAMLFFNSL